MFSKSKTYLILIVLMLLTVSCGSQATQATPSVVRSASTTTPSSSEGSNKKLQTVTLALDWTPNTNHTGIYVALQKGWYRENGVNLKILPYSETDTNQLVSQGKADFGISFEEGVVTSRAAGLDVISVAAIIQHNTSALVTLKESGINRPRMLDGKRYAGFGSPFEKPVISEVIKCDGGKGDFKTVTTNVFGYEALKAKRADFVWIFMGWEGIQAKREGLKLNVFYIKDYCVPDYYTPVIITSRKFLDRSHDLAKRFMEATARGYEYAIKHPDDSAKILIQAAPKGTFPDPGLVVESQRWLSPRYKAEKKHWGVQDLRVWTNYPRFMYKTGNLLGPDNKPLKQEPDYKSYFTNELLPYGNS